MELLLLAVGVCIFGDGQKIHAKYLIGFIKFNIKVDNNEAVLILVIDDVWIKENSFKLDFHITWPPLV